MQRKRRLLENHGNARAANALECTTFCFKKILSFKKNDAPFNFSISGKES